MSSKVSFKQALKSAAAALFGVQNDKTRQQDFDTSTPFPFILAGVILVIGFLLLVASIVNLVIPN